MVAGLQPGDPPRIGPYELVGVLGGGGMGRVFLGRSAGGRPVAVKVIRAELAASPEFRTRFRREIAAAQKVNGLFTAGVVNADVDGPVPWLATAYVAGPSLEQAVAEHGPLPAQAVLALAAGLAEGLAAIHAAGVVHRDLKPSNVLLAADGPRVIDFGISHAAETSALTRTGLVLGSPGFMSPEQANGSEVGPPSDVFNLGAVLAFAASGQGPFGTGLTAALVYRIVHAAPQLEQVPGQIRPLVERCLAKDPAERPTASEVLEQTGTSAPAVGWLPEPVIGAFTLDAWPDPAPELHTVTAANQPSAPVWSSGPAPAPVPVLAGPEAQGRVGGGSRDRRRPRLLAAAAWVAAGVLAGGVAAAFALAHPGHGSAAAGGNRGPQVGTTLQVPSAATSPAPRGSASPSHRPSGTAPTPVTPVTTAPAPVPVASTARAPAPVTSTARAPAPVTSTARAPAPVTSTVSAPRPSPTPTTPSPTASVLGPVDLNAYCRSIGYSSAELVQNNAYGWKCVASNGATSAIDIIAACRAEYHDPQATAKYSDYNNPDSWYCLSS